MTECSSKLKESYAPILKDLDNYSSTKISATREDEIEILRRNL